MIETKSNRGVFKGQRTFSWSEQRKPLREGNELDHRGKEQILAERTSNSGGVGKRGRYKVQMTEKAKKKIYLAEAEK